MHVLKTWLGNPNRNFPVVPLVCAVLVLLLARNLGTYAGIFADEYYYSAFARMGTQAEAGIPSYLFYALFRSTSTCGDGFLECARLLNVVLLVASAPFIYASARRLMPPTRAGVVTVLAMVAPFNVYTAYFMPETTYFLAFWIMTWQALRMAAQPSAAAAAGAGALMGVAGLVKVHAMFLAPPLCVFVVYVAWAGRSKAKRHWLLDALVYLGAALAAAALVRLGMGYLFAGKAGLNLFGTFYAGAAGNSKPMLELVVPALHNLRGHLLGLAFLFALPLAAMLLGGVSRAARRETDPALSSLVVYATLMLGALVGMTSMYSASVVGNGPGETLTRLHLRYYDFVFPLFLLIAGAQVALHRPGAAADAATAARRQRLAIALGLAVLVLLARFTLMRDFTPNFVDAPELWSLKTPALMNLATALSLFTLACWVVSRRSGARAYLYLTAPVLMLAGAAALGLLVRDNGNLDAYARAGSFTRDHLNYEQVRGLTIIGDEMGALFRAKFHLDHPEPDLHLMEKGKPFTLADLGKRKDWALVVGDHAPPEGAIPHNVDHGFVLYEMQRPDKLLLTVDFTQQGLGFEQVRGLSTAESWGRWSDGKQLAFETARPLPVRLRLYLVARAVGANVGAPIIVRVGDQQREATLGAATGTVVLDFDTSGNDKLITIDVPHPIPASSFGVNSHDSRQIGLALVGMELAERKEAPARLPGVGGN